MPINEILKIWIKDGCQLTIWLLWLSLLALTWTHIPKIQLIQKFFEQPGQIMIQIMVSSIALNIAVSLSFIRYLYKIKAKDSKDIFKDYYFFPTAQAWLHKAKRAERACAKCKVEDKFSPLALTESQDYFICPSCNTETPNIPREIFTTSNSVNIIVPMTPIKKT